MTDIHHRIGVQSSSTDDVYAALTTIDGLSGWWTTDTTGDPGLGGKIEFRFPPGGFDMEVIELDAGRAGPVAGRRRPSRVDRHHRRLAPLPHRRVHDRPLHPRGLGRAGRVPRPLLHQVGGVPAEPQGAGRDRHRRPFARRRRHQRLALTAGPDPGAPTSGDAAGAGSAPRAPPCPRSGPLGARTAGGARIEPASRVWHVVARAAMNPPWTPGRSDPVPGARRSLVTH